MRKRGRIWNTVITMALTVAMLCGSVMTVAAEEESDAFKCSEEGHVHTQECVDAIVQKIESIKDYDVMWEELMDISDSIERRSYRVDTMFATIDDAIEVKAAYESLDDTFKAEVDEQITNEQIANINELSTLYETSWWEGRETTIEQAPDEAYIYQFPSEAERYQRSPYTFTDGGGWSVVNLLTVVKGSATGTTSWIPNSVQFNVDSSNYEVTYCCDVDTNAMADQFYRKINVEDSTYYDDDTAAKVRSILQNVYPYVSAQEMLTSLPQEVKDKLSTTVAVDEGQLFTAVQLAIWTVANGYEPGDLYPEDYTLTRYSQFAGLEREINPLQYDEAYNTNYRDYWKAWGVVTTNAEKVTNIEAIMMYLLNRAEEAPMTTDKLAISNVSHKAYKKGTGIYDVAVEVLLNAEVDSKDRISIQVDAEKEGYATVSVVKSNTDTNTELEGKKIVFYLEDVQPGSTITINVSGEQYLEKGVYFYEPYDTEPDDGVDVRDISQNLVGISSGYSPITATTSFNVEDAEDLGDGSILVTKRVGYTNANGTLVDLIPAQTTYYVGLFKDVDGEPAEEASYVKEIVMDGVSVGTATFTELTDGIWYIFETDEDGNIIENTVGGQWVETTDDDEQVVEISVENEKLSGYVSLYNMYTTKPNNFRIKGEIQISKEVIINGETTETEDIFYAGIFANETDETPLQVVELVQGEIVTAEVALGENGEAVTYYVYETDVDGNKVGDGFAYEVSGEGAVVVSQENPGEIELVNALTTEDDNKNDDGKKDDDKKDEGKKDETKKTEETKTDSVDTGDHSNPVLYLALAVIAIAAVVAVLVMKKRNV